MDPEKPGPLTGDEGFARLGFSVALLIGCAIVSLICVSGARDDSATDDEPAHIVSGYLKLKAGALDFYPPQLPLIHLLIGAPVVIADCKMAGEWESDPNHWGVGRQFLYASGNDARHVILLARLPVMALFLAVCLAVTGFVLEATGHRLIALGAFLLTGFCPNLLAHGRLATVDMAAALSCFLTAWAAVRFLRNPTMGRAVVVGLIVALALETKVTCLILLPYLAALFVVQLATKGEARKAKPRRLVLLYILMGGVAIAVLECLYLIVANGAFVARTYPSMSDGMLTRLALPFLEYARNFNEIYGFLAGRQEHPQFLLGSFSTQGWWYYYPTAFALKTPLGSQLLLLFTLVVFAGIWIRGTRLGAIARPLRLEALALIGFVLLFFAVAMPSKIDLGVRYILPVYPFLYAAIMLAVHVARRAFPLRARLVATFAAVIVAWSVAEGLRAYPGYLGYFNQIVREPQDADRYLVDSNLDWGQDLGRLARWAEQHGVPKIRVMYFGGGDLAYDLGGRGVAWPASQPREPGFYAVSRHIYRMSTRDPERFISLEDYFAGTRLVEIVGTSIYVFEDQGGSRVPQTR